MESTHLLLVDDEDSFRQPLSKRLIKRGFVVEQAADGHQCLALLGEKRIDVVVLDVKMPGMSGIDVLQNIKSKYPGIEVIMLTGHATTASGVEGIKSGAFDYLTKPIELDQLVNKIIQAREKILRLAAEHKEAEYRKKIEQQMVATERLASLGSRNKQSSGHYQRVDGMDEATARQRRAKRHAPPGGFRKGPEQG